jgi:uncharacterized membrane protein YGL010W
MSALEQKLSAYAAYHRDRRNVTAHMLGIPLIVLAVEILLSRPVFAGMLTPAMLATALAAIYYFTLDTRLATALTALLTLSAWAGLVLARLPTPAWAATGIGLFVVGWIIQFIGHDFEGRKPAFLDDLTSLLIGPLFIAAETAVLLGLRRELKAPLTGALTPPR